MITDQGVALAPPEDADNDVYAFPLSFAQERLWFLDQLQPGQSVYNMYDVIRWVAPLSLDTLERALLLLAERHETLRTCFVVDDDEPVQLVYPTAAPVIELIDLMDRPEADRAAIARATAIAVAARPFDLGAAPLLRAHVIREAPDLHRLVLVIHHIVSDGWSMRVLFRELGALYDAVADDRPASLPPLPLHYADYAIWQRAAASSARTLDQLAYWQRQLAGAPPLHALATDRSRPPAPSYRGALHMFLLSTSLTEAVNAFAQREAATPFMVLLAAFKLLLARHGDRDDIVVGTPTANRMRSELEGLIGFFANTLVLRTRLPMQQGFRAIVAAVRQTTLDAYEHQDVSFERVVEAIGPERALDSNPLFQIMFVLNAFDAPGVVSSRSVDVQADDGYREISIGHAKFDLHFSMIEVGGRLRGVLEYATDLFDAPRIERLANAFVGLLQAALANPDAPVGRLPLTDETARETAIAAAASPWPAIVAPPFIHRQVSECASRMPEAVAIRAQGEAMNYATLDRRANALAHRLVAAGVGPDVPVGIHVARSSAQIIAVLAVLKAGGCYVPLDPSYPAARLLEMLRDSGAPIVITSGTPPPFDGPRPMLIDDAEADAPPAETIGPQSLAYILYTSGSTGKPKGVAMPHAPLANLVAWQIATALPATRVLQFTSLNFDVSAQEIFSTLASGATLVIASEDERRDPHVLRGLLAAEGIERLFLPAAALQALTIADAEDDADGESSLALCEIITAGEQLQVSPAMRRFAERHQLRALRNQYGPTETHVASEWSLQGPPAGWPELPPVGRAIAGGRLYVLDEFGEPSPDGMPGEIHIGGCLLARGYVGRADETAARFVPDPLAMEAGARRYRTGDLGRRRPDGAVEFLGRCDRQVKVRGVRVEPGEIEAVLRAAPGVAEVAVFAEPDPGGGNRLVACIVPIATVRQDAEALRDHCRRQLPEAMVPARYITLDMLPRTPSGKIARDAIPALATAASAATPPADANAEDEPPVSALEAALAAIWCEVLRIEQVRRDDNFFSLGGHSLLATRVVARIRKRFALPVPLRTLFEHPTIAALSAAMLELEAAEDPTPDAAQRTIGGKDDLDG